MYARLRRQILPMLAVLLPVAVMCQTTQASASAAALKIELRSDATQSVAYAFSPSSPTSYVAAIEGTVDGAKIDPTTCGATLGGGGTTAGPRASVTGCAGLTITADLAGTGSDQARVTVSSEGRPLAYGQGTVVVTTEPDPANPAAIIVIIIIIILVLIPLTAS